MEYYEDQLQFRHKTTVLDADNDGDMQIPPSKHRYLRHEDDDEFISIEQYHQLVKAYQQSYKQNQFSYPTSTYQKQRGTHPNSNPPQCFSSKEQPPIFSKIYGLRKQYLLHSTDNQNTRREPKRSTSQTATVAEQRKCKGSTKDYLKGKQSQKQTLHQSFLIHTSQVAQKKEGTKQGQKTNLRNILKAPNFKESQSQKQSQQQFEEFRKELTELQAIPEDMQSLEMYWIGKTLGQGATAEVKMAKHRELDIPIAMKIYDKKKMSQQAQKNLEREVQILYQMKHPNIIRLHHQIVTDKQIYLVMEYTSPTCLNTYMRGRPYKRISEDDAKVIFKQLVDSMSYLHEKNILHRDIKLENILIDYTTKKIKLIDFGYSVIINPTIKAQVSCGTPSYMAPEIIRKSGYSFGADVWACGIILYKIATGVFPFRGNSEKELFRKILTGRMDFPSFISAACRSLILSMLKVDPAERVSISQVAENPWLNS